MCVIAWHWTPNQKLLLTLWANRDEWLDRPTLPFAPWQERPDWVGGRDLKAGGAWLLIDYRRGRLAALTNMRDSSSEAAPAQRPSRGIIPIAALSEEVFSPSPGQFDRYAGFNLLLFSLQRQSAEYFSPTLSWPTALEPGVGSISNGRLTDRWPKQKRLESAIGESHGLIGSAWNEAAWSALSDQFIPDDCELPNTGIGLVRERELAPVFINTESYGTRQSTVLKFWSCGKLEVWERSWSGHSKALSHHDIFWSTHQV